MKQNEALAEFRENREQLIESHLKNNRIDDITDYWNMYTKKLLLNGLITDKQYATWEAPNYETKSFIKTKITEGTIAIKEAKQRNKRRAVVMHVQQCKLNKTYNVPVKDRVCTYDLLSPGAQDVYDHFQQEGYVMHIEWTHDGGGIKEWFNLIATWGQVNTTSVN